MRVVLCVRAIKWSPAPTRHLTVSDVRSVELSRRPSCRGGARVIIGSPLRRATRRRDEETPSAAETRINDRIRVPEVRLVGPNGEQVGIVRIEDALRLAREAELDLVEVAAEARPPVCKLMDYGKFKYESAQKARESRRNQQLTVIKEQKLRPKIDTHDYETKRNVVRFLEGGNKVKVTIMFRGREQSRPELGFRLLQRLARTWRSWVRWRRPPSRTSRNTSTGLPDHESQKYSRIAAKFQPRWRQKLQIGAVAATQKSAGRGCPIRT